MNEALLFAGVELGGTKCIALLGRGPGDVVAREIVPTTSPDGTLGKLGHILAGWKSHNYAALGIASFGPLDLPSGTIAATPKHGWRDVEVRCRLEQAAGVPTALDTDVNGAALAEMRWGSGQGMNDFAYITVGTGVGVGLIVDGEPTRGFAHCELGHIRVARLPGDMFGGSCPFHGDCVEGLAAGPSIEARTGRPPDSLPDDDRAGQPVESALAQLYHAIVCAAAPQRIALGGGVIERRPYLLERVEGALETSLNGFIRLPSRPYLTAPFLGADAGPLGAIALAKGAVR